jgi:hypothetical protein
LFGSKTDKASMRQVHCKNSENCPLFAQGKCIALNFMGYRCPHGYARSEDGYTKKARAFSKWIRDREEKYKDTLYKLDSAPDYMIIIGDKIYLPYHCMNMNNDIPFESHGHFMSKGSGFLALEHFTVDNIARMCNFAPQALMGGTITSYITEVVPKFLTHLSEYLPKLYQELIEKYPNLQIKVTNMNHVGRKALLSTLKPDITIVNGDSSKSHWDWDGEKLTSEDYRMIFSVVDTAKQVTVIYPKPNATVKVQSNDHVLPTTKFID